MAIGIGTASEVIWAIACVIAAASLIRWLTRCKHPNPHYIRPATAVPSSGAIKVPWASRYECYECGRTWTAKSDPAWAPTPLVQKFVGFDEQKIHQAVIRAAVEEEQRRLRAVRRVVGPTQPATAKPASHRRQNQPSNIIDLYSRRPA